MAEGQDFEPASLTGNIFQESVRAIDLTLTTTD
jgi:hypothetical protein